MMREDEKNGIYMTKSERLREYANQIDDGIDLREQEVKISGFLLSLADTLDSLESNDDSALLEGFKRKIKYNLSQEWLVGFEVGAAWVIEQMRNKLK